MSKVQVFKTRVRTMEERPPICPQCGIVLLVDAPINLIMNWPNIIARYGSVAMHSGWENLPLEGSVFVGSDAAASCPAVYVGDLITPTIVCPRCKAPIYDSLRQH